MQAKKSLVPEPNYMVIHFNAAYDEKVVLPYKEGIAVLTALENAKLYKKPYNEESTVRDIQNDTITSAMIGSQEYASAILRTTLLSKDES